MHDDMESFYFEDRRAQIKSNQIQLKQNLIFKEKRLCCYKTGYTCKKQDRPCIGLENTKLVSKAKQSERHL
jgi:hypothetical protein